MKGNFSLDNLLQLANLEKTLSNHEPYVVMSISATGVNDATFSEHYPTRVTAQEYVYDDEVKNYVKGVRVFDEMVKCSEESLQHALNSNYDVFVSSGIDREAYIRGENVLSISDFQKQFGLFMSGTKENTKIITNNTDFCIQVLDKVNCGDMLREAQANHTLLDQPTLTAEYFDIHRINASSRLENLNNVLQGRPATEAATKIVGLDKRNDITSRFVAMYGAEKGILPNQYESLHYEQASQYIQSISEQGKSNYRNATFERKLEILLKSGVLTDAVLDRNSDCHLNKLLDVYDNKNGIKGVTIMQSASSGFKAGDAPMQVSIVVLDCENGSLNDKPKKVLSMDITIDNESLSAAVSQAKSGQFDAFAYTGINMQAYLEGKATEANGTPSKDKLVVSQDKALEELYKFFKNLNLNEYPILTNGIARNDPQHGWSQNNLAKIGNLPAFDAPFIDVAQVIKEYSYRAYYDEAYPNNALIDVTAWDENKTFALQEVAKEAGAEREMAHTLEKVFAMAGIAESIFNQQNEMKLELEQQKTAPSIAVQADLTDRHGEEQATPVAEPSLKDNSYSGEYEGEYKSSYDFASSDGYTNVSDAISKVTADDKSISSAHTLSVSEVEAIPEEQRLAAEQEDDLIYAAPAPISESEPQKELPSKESTNKEAPVVSQPSYDLSALVVAITAQTEAIKEQNNILMAQNTALMSAFEKQNNILNSALDMLTDKDGVNLDNSTIKQRLELVKEQLAAISDDVHSKTLRNSLSSANELIQKGQKALEQELNPQPTQSKS